MIETSNSKENLHNNTNSIGMNHGAGGRQMNDFIHKCVVDKLQNGILERLDDCAVLPNESEENVKGQLAMTTDSYVVSPLFFPGGDIGRLCICGTVNDLGTSGARPLALSLAFILEEGADIRQLEKIVDSIAATAKEAGVKIVTGDTKVVEKGKGDQIYINTCGIGRIDEGVSLSSYNARANDLVLLTGNIAEHEVAMMKARNMIPFEVEAACSDAAPLNQKIQLVISKMKEIGQVQNIRVVKDPTRGGVAQSLHEIASHSQVDIYLDESKIPVSPHVRAVCELTGMDPLYMANEGKYIIIGSVDLFPIVKEVFGKETCIIGKVASKSSNSSKSQVLLETLSGGFRKVSQLEVMQLPRIC